jgi:hypothetical protein
MKEEYRLAQADLVGSTSYRAIETQFPAIPGHLDLELGQALSRDSPKKSSLSERQLRT